MGATKVLVEPPQWPRNGTISHTDVAHFLVRPITERQYVHTAPALMEILRGDGIQLLASIVGRFLAVH
jgi:hypothetical protein